MADDLGKLLQIAADRWQSTLRRTLDPGSPAAALGAGGAVLQHLDAAGISQTVLTARLGLSKQAVQQLLDQLESQGLVRREADPTDRRAKRVFLTEPGAAAAQSRQAAAGALEDRLREALGKKRFKALRKVLRDFPTG